MAHARRKFFDARKAGRPCPGGDTGALCLRKENEEGRAPPGGTDTQKDGARSPVLDRLGKWLEEIQ